MLVLTRRLGEVLRIGEGITVKIVDVKGKHVKIGINAPVELPIYREEVYKRVHDENQLSSALSLDEFGRMKEALRGK